ncbi:LuxR C-terminal-related transcriptional regulator [Phytohabitans sp. ZYX-F-186]|uniref:LuxR C-terminal-related transcriptional regulator n=1 Tax=Phytohabitans maris TaxID=3071409 RepID=A0ABU0ZWV3_9ACTN|nr:LuxR C-terminal-related transcriptional regulator [Phytohabitans sp. ZYX-F-186]MDQ7911472.1 LuxR C-terminal-related transcriptional regulator [Phytohabitans sp. ZYX-F-186]
MLEAFGVDPSAEKIYLAMLKQPGAGTASLAASLGWTEDAVKDALDELARLSLLRPSWEDPELLRPVLPEVGLEILLARQRAELLRRQHQIEEGRAAIEALVAEHNAHRAPGESAAQVEELLGVDTVREALERISFEARHQLLTFAPDGAQTAEALTASRPLNQRVLERGIEMRTIYLTSARNDRPTAAHARWLVEMGAQVRTVPVLPLRMLIVDRARAVVPLDPSRTSTGACILHGPGAIAAMCALFEQQWQHARPWGGDQATRGTPDLTDQDRALLQLLLRGDTDEQAARRLGVSARTVGRMAAELMARLGARSRFQAGALAAEQGWLRPPPREAAPS